MALQQSHHRTSSLAIATKKSDTRRAIITISPTPRKAQSHRPACARRRSFTDFRMSRIRNAFSISELFAIRTQLEVYNHPIPHPTFSLQAKSAQLPEIYRWQGRDSEKNTQMTSSRPFILVPFFSKRASAYRCALSFLLSILHVGAFSCCTYLISLVVDCGPDESFSRG